ncbi:hypothetical protein [Rhizobium laguerreae]|uniref:hypothetical protein n=1 Tax=Rhizobium laguerreae TaxID=1076926 RepID=UPI00103C9A49|nr:hypothetical protein [Rhizobium laguerreae]TBY08173.1 hypothetical protein E0J21_14335 [Rhizobium laguerreae]
MTSKLRFFLLAVVCLSGLSSASAADLLPVTAPTPEARADGWNFSFSPYFWIAGLDGETSVLGLPTVDVSQDFGDILSGVDFAFMGAGDARYDRYSIFTDMAYVRVTTDSGTPRGILAGEVDLKSVTFTALIGGAYTLYEDDRTRFDVLAGARYWHLETTLSFSGGLLAGVSRTDKEDWVDAIVGVKGSYAFNDHIFMTGWGMIGAGGATLDWDVLGALGYKFNDTVSAVLGYRAQGVDYSNDDFSYDMIQHGPIIGMTIRF